MWYVCLKYLWAGQYFCYRETIFSSIFTDPAAGDESFRNLCSAEVGAQSNDSILICFGKNRKYGESGDAGQKPITGWRGLNTHWDVFE